MIALGITGVFLAALAISWAIFTILPFWRSIQKWHSALDEFPHFPFHWLWGNVHQIKSIRQFFEDTLSFVQEGAKSYIYWIFFYRPVLVVAHLETVKTILRTSEPKAKGGGGYDFLIPWLGDGLLLSSGKKWERNRRLLTPAFHFDILRPYVKIYNQSTEGFMKNLEAGSKGGNSVEVFGPAGLSTLDTMLQCALSYTDDIQEKGRYRNRPDRQVMHRHTHPYVKAVTRMATLLVERAFNLLHYITPIYNLSSNGREFARHVDYVHQFSETIIESRKKALESDPALLKKRHLDFLDILLSARDETGQGLTDKEIRDEVDTFMFEGHDTTSSAISWCLYCLARYQEEQQKVLQDVLEVIGNKNEVEWQRREQVQKKHTAVPALERFGKIVLTRISSFGMTVCFSCEEYIYQTLERKLRDDLSKLQYVPMFIRETMRLYPPVPFISRQLSQPLVIDGVKVPKGVMVDINMYQTHRNTNVWQDCLEFNPARFDPNTSAGRDPYCFVPFSAGPRNCIGQNFAMNDLKVMVCQVVRRFRIDLDPSKPAIPKPEVVLRTEEGLYLKFSRRM